jgi:hypothetical protein
MHKLTLKTLFNPLNITIFLCYVVGIYILHISLSEEAFREHFTLREIIHHTETIIGL